MIIILSMSSLSNNNFIRDIIKIYYYYIYLKYYFN